MHTKIQNNHITLEATTLGAELQSIQCGGTEYLWQGDAAYWTGRAPVLFPVIGGVRNNQILIAGKPYPMQKHGFARKSEFTLIAQTQNSLTYSLKSNESSQKSYPFDFELQIQYKIAGKQIENRYLIYNHDAKPMPFFIGGHPAFRCPLFEGETFEDYRIEFEQPETAACPLLQKDTLINTGLRTEILQSTTTLPLSHALFQQDALIFDRLKSRGVKLINRRGKGVSMRFHGFDYFGLWTAPNHAPYLCLEPWTGINTTTDEDDHFEQKRGVQFVDPGQSQTLAFYIEIL